MRGDLVRRAQLLADRAAVGVQEADGEASVREQFVAEGILRDGAHDGVFAGDVADSLRQGGERFHLAEEVARAKLAEHQLAPARLRANLDEPGDDQADRVVGMARGEDLLARLELVELGDRLQAISILPVEVGEALAGREGMHGKVRLPHRRVEGKRRAGEFARIIVRAGNRCWRTARAPPSRCDGRSEAAADARSRLLPAPLALRHARTGPAPIPRRSPRNPRGRKGCDRRGNSRSAAYVGARPGGGRGPDPSYHPTDTGARPRRAPPAPIPAPSAIAPRRIERMLRLRTSSRPPRGDWGRDTRASRDRPRSAAARLPSAIATPNRARSTGSARHIPARRSARAPLRSRERRRSGRPAYGREPADARSPRPRAGRFRAGTILPRSV